VHIANFVVPPEVTLAVLRGLDPASVPVVWFQPGAFDEEVVSFARKRFRHVVAGDCIMVVTRLV
jgi:predicted CoA-binding protein